MASEIERKFLVVNDSWRTAATHSIRMRQGYLSGGYERSVRVRTENDRAIINIKSSDDGIHRLEYEYEIPFQDAGEILDRIALRPLIEKTRHIQYGTALVLIALVLGMNLVAIVYRSRLRRRS